MKSKIKVKNIMISMKKTNQGIAYFTNRRDIYIKKSRQPNISDALVNYFKEKANDMQACIDRVVLRKTDALATFN